MGTVVLCTSCPLLNECVISHNVCFPLKKKKKHAYSFFQLSILYFSSQSYMDLIFYPLFSSPGTPFYSKAAQEHTFVCYLSVYSTPVFILLSVLRFHPNKTCTNHDEVHPAFFFFYSKLYSIVTTWHTFGMLSDMLIVFLITSELCKPSVFGLPLKKYHRKPIYYY